MGRRRIQRIQDSVHGLMEFEGVETLVVEVLRANELQRLRRIRQLGLAHFVFPGAEHSRLVHAIGAAHLATRFARQLRSTTRECLVPFFQPNESVSRDFALAALCHDLGHGPLSHMWEREVVGEHFDRRAWVESLGLPNSREFENLKWHELVGQALINWPEGELHRILEQQESGTSQRVARLLRGEYYVPYVGRLLSSDVDVDRCDFILRDAHNSGVAYGRFDLDWLISTAGVGETHDGKLVVGFDKAKAPSVLEQFLVARRALYSTLYYHKTVRCAEGMTGTLFRRFREIVRKHGWPMGDNKLFQPFRKVMEGSTLQPAELLGLDDNAAWVLIQHLADEGIEDPTATDLAKRLVSRDLFKAVPCSSDELNDFLLTSEAHEKLNGAIQPYVPGKSEYYLHIDKSAFRMLGDKLSDQAYLLDFRASSHPALPLKDHPLFRTYLTSPTPSIRLFVPREAVEAAVKVINAG